MARRAQGIAMPPSSSTRFVHSALALAAGVVVALPAQAQSSPPPPPMAPAYAQPQGQAQPGYDRAAWDQARADWLDECRANRRRDRHGNTIGGALIGGAVGAVLGNAVAGRGDKTLGTVAGAVAGAVAGGAIGSSADRRQERRTMDYCESYLERHMGYGGYGYAQPGYGYQIAYQPMTGMVPVMMDQPVATAQPAPATRECTETQVIEEWVPVGGTGRRIIPPRRHVPDKRIPDKRIPL
jgi:uncharacterized protein YcfJ